jgi:hypothetical protein
MILDAARHRRALHASSMLTASARRLHRPDAAMVKPEKVIRVLNEAGVRFVVMGTHGITGYRGEPRATQDVDILVPQREHARAVEAVQAAFPRLEVEEQPVVTRFRDPKTEFVVIDLMRPATPLLKLAYKQSVAVGDEYRIPNLEMALASKYAAMISPVRPLGKKYTDAGDFVEIVQHNYDKIRLKKLRKLAEGIYEGPGDEIVKHVEDARAGRTLDI